MVKNYKTHPSYGMLQFSRLSGGHQHLFGSAIPHESTIQLKISHGSVARDLNTDWYSEEEPIVVLEMSAAQFAEAMTTLNYGNGVPVTIKYLGRKRVEDCPFEDKLDQFNQELTQDIKEISGTITNLAAKSKEYLSKGNLKADERKELASIIHQLTMAVKDNLPFLHTCMNEAMEKSVMQAKAEIEAQVQHVVTKFGLEKLEEITQSRLQNEKS